MLTSVIDTAIMRGATDIHIACGSPPFLRHGRHLTPISSEELCTPEDMRWLRSQCEATSHTVLPNMSDDVVNDTSSVLSDNGGFVFSDNGSYDGAFSYEGLRIRVHLFSASGTLCGTLRLLYDRCAALGDSDEDRLLIRLSELREGLILLTGPTGSGKSFTLAACLEYINRTRETHIITLEDPVEYVFTGKRALIHQRQLGQDVVSMAEGVRDALREDPDVLMIGELRDRSTLEAALHAAETGHLVFATMHTQRAVMAINRMISLFPAAQQDEVRSQLSQVLRAVICQRLIITDTAFYPLRDILLNTKAVANLIRQRKEPQIISIQETQRPMQTMEMAADKLRRQVGSIPELEEVMESIHELV
ncbi:type IV pilus twitching motility protein PilT [uncultured Veillonella sp.]|uniref:type IV pilus twitching motility protein PilT n=1 Tax=uncultured Veillonella sp. TaxID=159268 RepID=UPI002588A429|nr:ATPase, T2SS/T4P/T4SS family [uncultured Veillonella sp.]